jgi:hypothetical protein
VVLVHHYFFVDKKATGVPHALHEGVVLQLVFQVLQLPRLDPCVVKTRGRHGHISPHVRAILDVEYQFLPHVDHDDFTVPVGPTT